MRHLCGNQRVSDIAVTPGLTVLCMSAEERTDWDRFAVGSPEYGLSPCWDCSPEFAAQMTALYRCNGVPGVPLRFCGPCDVMRPLNDPLWSIGVHRGREVVYTCRVCLVREAEEKERQKRRESNARSYAKIMGEPAKRLARKAQQCERDRARMAVPGVRERKQALDRARQRAKYQSDPAYRDRVTASNRARDRAHRDAAVCPPADV